VKSKSLRWRLTLSSLGIASLTVFLLGIVLFMILHIYYAGLEQNYLLGASQALPANILELLKVEDPVAELQGYFENLAFLSQTRIRVSDVEGDVLIDTGSPTGYSVALGVQSNPRITDVAGEGRFLESFLVLQERMEDSGRYPLDLPRLPDSEAPSEGSIETVTPTNEGEASRSGEKDTAVPITGTPVPEDEVTRIVNKVPVYSTSFGFSFTGEDASSKRRSSQELRIGIYDTSGLLATIEFSEGPAYGRQVLSSGVAGFSAAGVLAISLAAIAGWWSSRRLSSPLLTLAETTTRMAQGELSGRVAIDREDEIGILARSFNTMADRVENTVHALRRFVSDAAHELNTPLTAIRTNLELIFSEQDERLQRSYVDSALIQTKRLEELAAALLDLSRLESGVTQENVAPVHLGVLIREESERFASTAEQEGIEFVLELPKEEIVVSGRSSQLRRVVSNLLDNAIKFTPEGGEVRIGCEHAGEWIEIRVEDTGIGIPSDEIPLLFNRFHRARNALGYPGNGLGLAIVKWIVESHGGAVEAEDISQGSCFTIRLPEIDE
jgi:signal transduction histidine kinase